MEPSDKSLQAYLRGPTDPRGGQSYGHVHFTMFVHRKQMNSGRKKKEQ